MSLTELINNTRHSRTRSSLDTFRRSLFDILMNMILFYKRFLARYLYLTYKYFMVDNR